MAVKGKAPPGGDFVVTAVLPAGLPPQISLPKAAAAAADGSQDKYVAMVSGLHLASSKADYMQVKDSAHGPIRSRMGPLDYHNGGCKDCRLDSR